MASSASVFQLMGRIALLSLDSVCIVGHTVAVAQSVRLLASPSDVKMILMLFDASRRK
jgi:hypothetical protein